MRKLALIIALLLAALAAVVAVAAMRLNTYLETNRAWIEAQAAAALGRPVSFDALRVSFRDGLAAEVTDLRVSDVPDGAPADLLHAARAEIVLRILPALFGRYEIGRIVVDEPSFTIVRTAGGLNIAALGRQPNAGTAPATARVPTPSVAVGALASFLISALELHDGELRFVDRTLTPPGELRVRRVDLTMTDIGLSSPIHVDLTGAVFADTGHDVSVAGTVGPLLENTAADVPLGLRIDGGPAALGDLQRLPWLAGIVPPTSERGAPVRLRAALEGTAGELTVSASVRLGDSTVEIKTKTEALTPLTVSVTARADALRPAVLGIAGEPATDVLRQLEGRAILRWDTEGPSVHGSIRSPEGALRGVAYTNLAADLELDGGQLRVPRFAINALGGVCDGSAAYDLRDPARPVFHLHPVAHGLAVADLLALSASKETAKMRGRLDADADIQGAGADRSAIEPTLTGTIRMDVQNGVLEDINLAEKVLTSVGGVPGLTDLISPQLRNKYPGVFSSGDTRFETLSASARVGGGRAATDDLTLATRDYALRAKGWVGFDNRLHLDATLLVSPALTADLIASAKQVQLLANSDGRIEIPFTIRGKLRQLRVAPDADFVARTLSRALQSDLGTLFGKKKRRNQPATGATPGVDLDRLRQGLDNLFRR